MIIITLSFHCGKNSNQKLYIFNWTDYLAPELVQKFEKEYNCEVIYDMYNSNENMLTRLLSTQAKYDIIVPTGYFLEIMKQKNLLSPINKKLIPNWENLSPQLLKKAEIFDPQNQYGIPYFWGTNGLIYNKKHIAKEKMRDVSWNIIIDTIFSYKNLISMLEDSREVVGIALITAGYTPNTTSDEALEKAEKILIEWDKNISHYDSDSYKNEIQDETIWLAQAYNGDAEQITKTNKDIGFVLPKEGSSLGIDFLVIPDAAENKDLAHQFINFLLEPENGKINALYVQYATPNIKAKELLPDSIKNNFNIYPDEVYLEKCHFIKDIGKEIIKIDSIWQKIRNN